MGLCNLKLSSFEYLYRGKNYKHSLMSKSLFIVQHNNNNNYIEFIKPPVCCIITSIQITNRLFGEGESNGSLR